MTDIQHARLRFPHIVTKDLHDLAALSSNATPIDSKSGEARASLTLDVDAHHVAEGAFGARFDDLRLNAGGMDIAGQGDAHGKLRAELDRKAASVRDFSLTVKDVNMHAGGRDVKDWWTTADVPYAAALDGGERIDGRFSLRAKNAAPLLDVLVQEGELPGIVPKLTSLPDLRVRAEVRKDNGVTDAILEPVENELFDVAGRYWSKGDHSRLAIVVGGKAISLGIAKQGGSGTTLKPFAREGWLNEQLKTFPPPGRRFIRSEP